MSDGGRNVTELPPGVKTRLNPVDLRYFLDLPQHEILARAIRAEADDQPVLGQVAICNVVMARVNNKLRWDGMDIHSVLLASAQFSCFNPFDPGFWRLKMPATREHIVIAELAVADCLRDVTDGAQYYVNPERCKVPAFFGRLIKTAVIGDHWFYRNP
jgi:hypothetical protein